MLHKIQRLLTKNIRAMLLYKKITYFTKGAIHAKLHVYKLPDTIYCDAVLVENYQVIR